MERYRRRRDDPRDEDEEYAIPYERRYYHEPQVDHNVSSATITIKDLLQAGAVIATVIFGGFGIWNNLSQELITQKLESKAYREQNTKEVESISATLKDLKLQLEQMKNSHDKDTSEIERHVQELDSTLTQLYQQVNSRAVQGSRR